MTQPHKHAAVIKAWADGATVQVKYEWTGHWYDLPASSSTWHALHEYRIKPEPKPDVVKYGNANLENGRMAFTGLLLKLDNVKLTFDGETHALKAVEIVK